MNRETLQGRWKQVKGKVREQWGNLTNSDVDRVKGSYEQLVGRLQEKYRVNKEETQNVPLIGEINGRIRNREGGRK